MCIIHSAYNKDLNDSPAGAFFGQYVRKLSSRAALQCGIGNIHMHKARDLRHITKGILYYHHVVASAWWPEQRNLTIRYSRLPQFIDLKKHSYFPRWKKTFFSILYFHHVVLKQDECLLTTTISPQIFPLHSSLTIFVLKEQRWPTALQLSSRHDSNSITKQVGLIHKVCGEQDGAPTLFPLQKVPGGTSSWWIHTRCGLI